MMRITVEIVPYGVEEQKYTIGQWEVFNKGREAMGFATYGIIEMKPEWKSAGMFKEDLHHSRQDGFVELARKVMERSVMLDEGE